MMIRTYRHFVTTALCSTAVAMAAPALAQETSGVPFSAPALTEQALGTIAGREDVNQHALANLNAGVSNNRVGDNSSTGDAKISDNAFQNLSGLSILNVNTGNNVAINAAMNVNISITPGK